MNGLEDKVEEGITEVFVRSTLWEKVQLGGCIIPVMATFVFVSYLFLGRIVPAMQPGLDLLRVLWIYAAIVSTGTYLVWLRLEKRATQFADRLTRIELLLKQEREYREEKDERRQ